MKTFGCLASVGFCVLVAGCAGDLEPSGEFEAHEEAAQSLAVDSDFDGQANDGIIDHRRWPGVGYLSTGCTATYLRRAQANDPPMALTAAHCVNTVANPENVYFSVVYDTANRPYSQLTWTANEVEQHAARHYVKDIQIYPNWVLGANDVAILTLDSTVTDRDGQELEGYELAQFQPANLSATVALGHGNTGGPFDNAMREGVVIPQLIDYISPARPVGNNFSGSIYRTGQAHNGTALVRGAMLLPGDSGGPLMAFNTNTSRFEIIGVASRSSHTSDPRNTSAWSNWTAVFNPRPSPNQQPAQQDTNLVYEWLQARRHGPCGANSFDHNDDYWSGADMASKKAMSFPGARNNATIDCAIDWDVLRLGTMQNGDSVEVALSLPHSSATAGDLDTKFFRTSAAERNLPMANNFANRHNPHTLVGEHNSRAALELETFSITQNGDHFLRVYGWSGATNTYQVTRCEDDGAGNTSQATAENLMTFCYGLPQSCFGGASERTTCPDSNGDAVAKYFDFNYVPGGTQLGVYFDHEDGPLKVEVLGAAGNVLLSRQTTTDNIILDQSDFSSSMSAGTYTLKVSGAPVQLQPNFHFANTFDVSITTQEQIQILCQFDWDCSFGQSCNAGVCGP